MALELVSQGTALNDLSRTVAATPGDSPVVIEVDLRDSLGSCFLLQKSLGTLDATIRAIPGIHLVDSSSLRRSDGVCTLRVAVRTNPLPLIPIAVATAVVGVLGLFSVMGWRLYKASPIVVGGLMIFGVLAIAAAVFLALR